MQSFDKIPLVRSAIKVKIKDGWRLAAESYGCYGMVLKQKLFTETG